MKKAICISLFFVFACSASLAQLPPIKNLPTGTIKTAAREKSSGKQLWSNVINYKKTTFKGKPMYYIEEKGQGIYGNDRKFKTWISKSFFELDGEKIIPNRIIATYKDAGGNTVRTMEQYYYPDKNSIFTRVNGKPKSFAMSKEQISKENLSVCLINFPFETAKSMRFNMLTNEPAKYDFTARLLGKESVDVSGRRESAYKFMLIPELGALNLIDTFVPKMYFWVSTEHPHEFLRYEGLESGLGTPYVIIEAVK